MCVSSPQASRSDGGTSAVSRYSDLTATRATKGLQSPSVANFGYTSVSLTASPIISHQVVNPGLHVTFRYEDGNPLRRFSSRLSVVAEDIVQRPLPFRHGFHIGISHHDEADIQVGGTTPIRSDFFREGLADVLLTGELALRADARSNTARVDAATHQKVPGKHFLLPIFAQDDNLGEVTHGAILARSTLKWANRCCRQP
jgi:hypothetical protein